MSRAKKHHTESTVGILVRVGDKDDCATYSDCLMEAARSNKTNCLPCKGCARYKQVVRLLDAWQRKEDERIW